jgi:hypothetical protein
LAGLSLRVLGQGKQGRADHRSGGFRAHIDGLISTLNTNVQADVLFGVKLVNQKRLVRIIS